MQRIQQSFSLTNPIQTQKQLLEWSHSQKTICWLDSNLHENSEKEAILAIGEISSIQTGFENAFSQLEQYLDKIKDFAFGYLSYDLKNDLEKLHSNNDDPNQFADLFFFQPEKIIEIKQNTIVFKYPLPLQNKIESDWKKICSTTLKNQHQISKNQLNIQAKTSKKEYIQQVNKVLEYIKNGKVYELNYCQEFYTQNATINPLNTYKALNNISQSPFSAFFKHDHLHLLCASPERFLKKKGNHILSEPIKGTAKRDSNKKIDLQNKTALKKDIKEIAENIMIVDLVRNDLSHIAKKGSVKVEELCEVYSYKQVHQMISKIVCECKNNTTAIEAIKACYPMGSMTGAPKIAAMNYIEELENSKRGIYSGALGYFTPEQDFDFNVVIRSIVYNHEKKRVSFSVGSAITAKSDPEKEYNECLLKAKAMKQVLSQ